MGSILERAQAARRGFSPSGDDLEAIEELVDLLDLLPLAIEIAAARIAMLGPRKLLERAGDRFRLVSRSGGEQARQATLRATLDWSWELLTADERSALAQLSVFEGGFTVEAAEQVLELDELWAVDALQSLVNKSLVRPGTEDRFELLVSVQEYAAGKLREMSGVGAAELRHGTCFASMDTMDDSGASAGPVGAERWQRMGRDLDNLVVACRRAMARGDADVATATLTSASAILQVRGPHTLAAELVEGLLGMPALSERNRVHALLMAGRAFGTIARYEQAEACVQEALPLCRKTGNRRAEGQVHATLGILHRHRGALEKARDHYERAVAIAREIGDAAVEANTTGNLGILYYAQGRSEEALAQFQRALELFEELGDRHGLGIAHGNLGLYHQSQGELEEARVHFQKALELKETVRARSAVGTALGNLGELAYLQGRKEEAGDLLRGRG